jgi:predicted nucleotidyltransferase
MLTGMGQLQEIARDIGTDERTLRRAVQVGTVRATRPGPRRLALADGELQYLHTHFELVSALKRALRTEPNVRLAVLHGSVARGDDRPDSDVDLLVSLGEDRPDAAVKLGVRLERELGRIVDVTRLGRVERHAPLLLQQVLDEGRVLIDRDGEWDSLRARRSAIARRADASHRALCQRAAAAIDELVEG